MAAVDPIAPELFEYVTEYADEIRSGDASGTEPMDSKHALFFFAENFLAQFSSSYLRRRIVGFNDRSRADLVSARRRLQHRDGTAAAQLLIFHIEPLCNRIGEISYSNSEVDAEEFHLEYFPEFLDRIVSWLSEVNAGKPLVDAAKSAASAYKTAVGVD